MSSTETVFVNARFLLDPVTGVQRWAREIMRQWDAMLDDGEIDRERWRIVLLCPTRPDADEEWRHLELRCRGPLRSHLWEQLVLPLAARGPLVNLKNTAPIFHPCMSAMVHDMQVYATPDTYSRNFVRWYRFVLPRIARRARSLMTLSHFSASEIERWLDVPAADIAVTSCGHEHAFEVEADASILVRHGIEAGSYVLAVSSLNPNKNFAAVMDAVDQANVANLPLVIAGAANPRVFRGDDRQLPNGARHVGRVSDAELRALYEHALCLVFPSYYEGFGLPPLEAMAHGCPVIISNTSSLPEVGGNAALYCRPEDPADIARQIVRLIEDPVLRDELAAKGRAQASQFTWRACARVVWRRVETMARERRAT